MQAVHLGKRTALAALTIVFLGQASAGVVNYEAAFESSGQSMWQSGDSGSLDINQFVGLSWDETVNVNTIAGNARERVPGTGGTIPNPARGLYNIALASCKLLYSESTCKRGGRPFAGIQVPPPLGSAPPATLPNPISAQYIDSRTGAAASADTSGRVGFEIGLSADSGSVDSAVAYEVSLDVPDVVLAGEYVSLAGSSTLSSGALDSTFPTLAANLSLVAEAQASIRSTTCFVLLGCENQNAATGPLGGTFDLITINENGEGTIEYFEGNELLNGLLFQNLDPPQGLPTVISSPIADMTLYLPQPNAVGQLDDDGVVRGTAQDDLIDFTLDVDNVLSLGLTGTPNAFGAELDLGAAGTVDLTLIDVDLGPTLDLRQSFEFEPTLYVDLAFSQPVDALGFGLVSSLDGLLFDELPDFAFGEGNTWITPTVFLGYESGGEVIRGVELLNELFLDLDGELTVDALTATVSLLNLFDFDFGLGTIFDDSIDLFTTPALFSSMFAMNGFEDVALSAFRVSTAGVAVPEPGTLGILAVGMLALLRIRRRVLPGVVR
ncbi:MAG: PEP-CTERM sorting domain-containing protein [Pseudomonadales bacterium]